MIEPVNTRLRRRIDALSDELEQANAHIARLLAAQRSVRVRHRNRTCIYCGVPVRNARTCAEHKALLALDPEYAS